MGVGVVARRRAAPVEEASAATVLTTAEVDRLHELAGLFDSTETAPLHVVEQVAAIAGGPIEDFTGPHGMPMPLELWTWAHSSPAFTQFWTALADRLIEAVVVYRRESPSWWSTKTREQHRRLSRPADHGVDTTPPAA